MTTINDGGPAFPTDSWERPAEYADQMLVRSGGMTLRAYLAGRAMAGLMARPDERVCPTDRLNGFKEWRAEMLQANARLCCAMADALIAELGK